MTTAKPDITPRIGNVERHIDCCVATLPPIEHGPAGRKLRDLRDHLLAAKAMCRNIVAEQAERV